MGTNSGVTAPHHEFIINVSFSQPNDIHSVIVLIHSSVFFLYILERLICHLSRGSRRFETQGGGRFHLEEDGRKQRQPAARIAFVLSLCITTPALAQRPPSQSSSSRNVQGAPETRPIRGRPMDIRGNIRAQVAGRWRSAILSNSEILHHCNASTKINRTSRFRRQPVAGLARNPTP